MVRLRPMRHVDIGICRKGADKRLSATDGSGVDWFVYKLFVSRLESCGFIGPSGEGKRVENDCPADYKSWFGAGLLYGKA